MAEGTTLRIGESEAGPVELNLEVLLETRALITATSGGGKSGTVFQLCEQAVGHVPIFVIDPEDEYAPLRSKYPFVLAGPEGETPASPRTAALLAHRLLELRASAILSLYELPRAQRHEFVREFLTAMIDAPKSLWQPVIVVVDEAHVFAPEKGMGESVASGAVEDLATRGRKRGFCAVLATQRLAMLSKTVAANCQNKLVGRTSQIDQVRAAAELHITGKAEKDELWRELTRAKTGEFYAYGMAFGADEPVRFQVDRAETLPEKKDRLKLSPPPAPAAIQALLPKLAELPQEAERKARTEEELTAELQAAKRRIRELEEGASTMGMSEDIAAMERELEELRPLRTELDGIRPRIDTLEADLANAHGMKDRVLAFLADEANRITDFVASASRDGAMASTQILERMQAPVQETRAIAQSSPRPVFVPETRSQGAGQSMAKAERAILTVLAQRGPSAKSTVAAWAGYAVNGGGFNNSISACRTKDWLTGSDPLSITPEGRKALGQVQTLPRGRALLEMWQGKVSKAEREILGTLARSRRMPKERLAEACGYAASGGGFNNALSSLRTLELIIGSKDLELTPDFAEAVRS